MQNFIFQEQGCGDMTSLTHSHALNIVIRME